VAPLSAAACTKPPPAQQSGIPSPLLDIWLKLHPYDHSTVAASAKPAHAAENGAAVVIYFLVTAAGLLLFAIAGVFLVLMVRGGQLDDLDTPPIRMLHDDHAVRDRSSASSPATTAPMKDQA
jgi:nitrogen fixation-related uncharacterized protein